MVLTNNVQIRGNCAVLGQNGYVRNLETSNHLKNLSKEIVSLTSVSYNQKRLD